MLWFLYALVVQRIEQSRPKGLMWVRFLPRAPRRELVRALETGRISNQNYKKLR